MTLPPWHPKTAEERRAFIDRLHDELLSIKMQDQDASAELLQDMATRSHIERLGYKLQSAKRPGAPLTKDRSTPFEQALADALIMPSIFHRLWKRRNRTSSPMRHEIAADIWGLSADDAARLHDALTKSR